MERKMARFTTLWICAFSLLSCVAVWFFPVIDNSVREFTAQIQKKQTDREARYALLEQMSGLEIMDYNTQKVQEKVEEGKKEPEEIRFTGQMKLELPEGVEGDDVKISANYLTQEISIMIPNADKNYLYDYSIIGKSKGIANLNYISGEGFGTIVLTMDKVMEAKSSFDASYLYLDFLTPKEIFDHVVVVDAGHGGRMPGTISGNIYEKNITLDIVKQLKALFDEAGDKTVGVYYTRLDDTNPEFAQRVGLANSIEADLFVSVHINALRNNSSVEGTEVLYDEKAEDTAFDSREFAQICLEECVSAMGSKNLGIQAGNRIYVVRSCNMPSALVEVGFISNPKEVALLVSEDYQKKAAQGLYNAIYRSFDVLDEM